MNSYLLDPPDAEREPRTDPEDAPRSEEPWERKAREEQEARQELIAAIDKALTGLEISTTQWRAVSYLRGVRDWTRFTGAKPSAETIKAVIAVYVERAKNFNPHPGRPHSGAGCPTCSEHYFAMYARIKAKKREEGTKP